MRKTIKRTLSLLLCFCMALSLGVFTVAAEPVRDADGHYSLNAADYAGQWIYHAEGDYWSLDRVVYCADPVLPEEQCLTIYAPAPYMQWNEATGTVTLNPAGTVNSSNGVVYTAETAPIIYGNSSGGYAASTIRDVNLGYLNEGYVQVGVATRGKASKDADGNYIGQFPGIIVDLKAGVRFLKANDAVLPGSSERIVSQGASSGGALSAMLGASGNSPVFDSYLKAIGAADATDDIFIALASCPITNLSTIDASYEWYQGENKDYFLFNAMAFDREGNDISDRFTVGRGVYHDLGDNILGGAHEDELSAWMYNYYVDYIRSLGFDLGEDGRSGAYYEGLVKLYEDGLTNFIARYDEVKGVLNGRNSTAPETVGEYLESLTKRTSTGRDVADPEWFSVDANGVATMKSLDAIMINHAGRNKMCPSSDSYNYRSNENDVFVTADGRRLHFSPVVMTGLKVLIEDPSYSWATEDEFNYIYTLYQDYAKDVTAESAQFLEIMSPINYVIGIYEGDQAPYFHWRVGSADPDHGLPNAWLVHNALLLNNPEVTSDIAISWGMGHGGAELTDQDIFDYIDNIMTKEAASAASSGNGGWSGGTERGWNGNSDGGSSGGWGGGATLTVEQVMDNFYVLDNTQTRAFLAVGEDKALLVDTMYAASNVLDEVKKITSLPVEVVITHGHPDHIGGIGAFDACYINEADAYFLDGKNITLNYVRDGDKLTAGDFTFEVIETPGHTRGSISLLDRAHKLLISGDEVQAGPIMMFDEEADMATYAASMQKLLAYQDAIETIYAGHNDPTGPEYIRYCYEDATACLNGQLTGTPVRSWDGSTRVDYQGAHVAFRLAE